MRKFFSFFAIAAVVLGMASCGQNEPGTPDAGDKPTFTVTFLADAQNVSSITITPSDPAKYYNYGIWNKADAKGLTKAQVQSSLSLGSGNWTYPDYLEQGEIEFPKESWMSPKTDYALVVYYVSEGYIIDGDIQIVYFTTCRE